MWAAAPLPTAGRNLAPFRRHPLRCAANANKAMAQTTKTDKTSPAEQRRARLAAELRSNLRKRKQQARSRAERAGEANAEGSDRRSAPREPDGREGENP